MKHSDTYAKLIGNLCPALDQEWEKVREGKQYQDCRATKAFFPSQCCSRQLYTKHYSKNKKLPKYNSKLI